MHAAAKFARQGGCPAGRRAQIIPARIRRLVELMRGVSKKGWPSRDDKGSRVPSAGAYDHLPVVIHIASLPVLLFSSKNLPVAATGALGLTSDPLLYLATLAVRRRCSGSEGHSCALFGRPRVRVLPVISAFWGLIVEKVYTSLTFPFFRPFCSRSTVLEWASGPGRHWPNELYGGK